MSGIEYSETNEFRKDLKRLLRRFRSLKDDLETVKKAAIELYHVRGIDNLSIFQITGLNTAEIQIYKIKKFACKALKGKGAASGIRVIYAWHVKTSAVDFIEIYYKGDQGNEDRERIKSYLSSHQ